jgi:hypothetical protein
VIDVFLGFARCLELALWHSQRMIAPVNNVQSIWRFHFAPDALQQLQRTQRVPRSLHKQDRRSQRAQNLVPKFGAIAHGAKRIAETNETVDFLFQRNMTSNPSAHAFADKKY